MDRGAGGWATVTWGCKKLDAEHACKHVIIELKIHMSLMPVSSPCTYKLDLLFDCNPSLIIIFYTIVQDINWNKFHEIM